MKMPGGIHHIAIRVRDLPTVERFYRDVLGLSVLRRWPGPNGIGDRSVWMDLGDGKGTFLALESISSDGNATDPGNQEHPGLHLLALRIQPRERAAWEARLAAAGTLVSHRTAYTIYFIDPEGNRLGLSHHPDPAEQP